MIHENGTFEEPYYGDENGIVTCYMCKTDFDYELGQAFRGVRVFPSEESLRKSKPCVAECGIVQVGVRQLDGRPTALFMEHVAFNYEMGGAPNGDWIYPSEESTRHHEAYAFKYGIIAVDVFFKQQIAEPNFRFSAKRIKDDRENRLGRPNGR